MRAMMMTAKATATTTAALIAASLWTVASAAAPAAGPVTTTGGAAPAGKLPPAVATEMAEAIIAVNKALGLESWPMQGVKPCVDRGGQGVTAKDVTADDTRKCAAPAVEKGFPGLGKSYGLAILMASIGPVTVIALGTGDGAGWGAYSCDPGRACKPLKVGAPSKWGKRLAERAAKACAEPGTIWLPAGQRVCTAAAPAAAAK
jgi:hypothetical protein